MDRSVILRAAPAALLILLAGCGSKESLPPSNETLPTADAPPPNTMPQAKPAVAAAPASTWVYNPNAPNSVSPANFRRLPPEVAALLLYAKYNRGLLANDSLVRFWSTLGGNACNALSVFSNEFESAKALSAYRQTLSEFLDAIPAELEVTTNVELGQYDMAQGGFPLAEPLDIRRMNLTDTAPPPTKTGTFFSDCLHPFEVATQLYFLNDAAPTIRFIKVPVDTAQAFVARHPTSRQVTLSFMLNVSSTRQDANNLPAINRPANLLALIGTHGPVKVTDASVSDHSPLTTINF